MRLYLASRVSTLPLYQEWNHGSTSCGHISSSRRNTRHDLFSHTNSPWLSNGGHSWRETWGDLDTALSSVSPTLHPWTSYRGACDQRNVSQRRSLCSWYSRGLSDEVPRIEWWLNLHAVGGVACWWMEEEGAEGSTDLYVGLAYSGPPLIRTPEMCPPLYSGHFEKSQSILFNTNSPLLKCGHPTLSLVPRVAGLEGFHCIP